MQNSALNLSAFPIGDFAMQDSSRDKEIATEVQVRADDLCKALNKAGAVGLHIDVKFCASQREDGGPNHCIVTGWHSAISLSRKLVL